MPATYLITGCSQPTGLGFALATELANTTGNVVFATTRGDPTPAIVELMNGSNGQVKHIKLDVTSRSSAEEARNQVEAVLDGKGLDILINNAGYCAWLTDGIASMADSDLNSIFTTNVTSAHNVTSTFLPLLRKGTRKKVVNMSTTLGSISKVAANYSGNYDCPEYKITKAALNMLTAEYAISHASEGFTFIALTPGWLKTNLGGGDMADLEVAIGAKASLDVIHKSGTESNGKFLNILVPGWEAAEGRNQYDGKEVPW